MRDALIYHVASGQVYFTGIGLVGAGVLMSMGGPAPALRTARTLAVGVGVILIAISATPLPPLVYGAGATILAGWLIVEKVRTGPSHRLACRTARLSVLLVAGIGVALELPFHVMPTLPPMGHPPIGVVGDSISAGMGTERTTWPRLLAADRRVLVQDVSLAGATAASALEQAMRLNDSTALVLVEIGGNDILGESTPTTFERGLELLLTRLSRTGRRIVMLELPLPPGYNRFGEIQRRLAIRHQVLLVPKRVLLAVLTTPGATVDGIHLSRTGHRLMASKMWGVLSPAFRPRTAAPGSR